MTTHAPLLLLATALLAACAGQPSTITDGPTYPAQPQSSVVDIQVIRDSTAIAMTNTTANTYTNARLWANQWFSHPVAEWKPGQTLTLSLADFKDRYGTSFRAGGFFAIDNPEKLVQMQLQHGDTLTGFIVIGQTQ